VLKDSSVLESVELLLKQVRFKIALFLETSDIVTMALMQSYYSRSNMFVQSAADQLLRFQDN
jgi:hypothetical protein